MHSDEEFKMSTQPSDNQEAVIAGLSILAYCPDEMIGEVLGNIPSIYECTFLDLTLSGLYTLRDFFVENFIRGVEEFYQGGLSDTAEEFYLLMTNLGMPAEINVLNVVDETGMRSYELRQEIFRSLRMYSLEYYLCDSEWVVLRKLSKILIDEIGVGAWPVTDFIDFSLFSYYDSHDLWLTEDLASKKYVADIPIKFQKS